MPDDVDGADLCVVERLAPALSLGLLHRLDDSVLILLDGIFCPIDGVREPRFLYPATGPVSTSEAFLAQHFPFCVSFVQGRKV